MKDLLPRRAQSKLSILILVVLGSRCNIKGTVHFLEDRERGSATVCFNQSIGKCHLASSNWGLANQLQLGGHERFGKKSGVIHLGKEIDFPNKDADSSFSKRQFSRTLGL